MDYRSSPSGGDFTRCLMMSTRAALSQEQVFALFDIIPCMEYCELQRDAYGMSKGQRVTRALFTLNLFMFPLNLFLFTLNRSRSDSLRQSGIVCLCQRKAERL